MGQAGGHRVVVLDRGEEGECQETLRDTSDSCQAQGGT